MTGSISTISFNSFSFFTGKRQSGASIQIHRRPIGVYPCILAGVIPPLVASASHSPVHTWLFPDYPSRQQIPSIGVFPPGPHSPFFSLSPFGRGIVVWKCALHFIIL